MKKTNQQRRQKNKEKKADNDYNDFLASLRKNNPFDRDTAFDIPDNLTIEQTGKEYTSSNLCQKIEFIAKVSAEFERELAIMKSAILTFIDGSNLTFYKDILTKETKALKLLSDAMKNAKENLNNTTERLENEKKRLANNEKKRLANNEKKRLTNV